LGLDGHGDDPQRHPPQDVDHRDDQSQAGLPYPDDPSEAEQHAFLVLLDDSDREGQPEQGQHPQHDQDGYQRGHS